MAKSTAPKVKVDLYPTEPITFVAPVEIPTAAGETLIIDFTFKHRTKIELAKLGEARINQARERFEAAQAEEAKTKPAQPKGKKREEPAFPETPKLADSVLTELEESAEGILEIAEDWNVDGQEFNAKNLQQLFNLHGAAAGAISATYREALVKGRLGN